MEIKVKQKGAPPDLIRGAVGAGRPTNLEKSRANLLMMRWPQHNLTATTTTTTKQEPVSDDKG